jgi:transposase
MTHNTDPFDAFNGRIKRTHYSDEHKRVCMHAWAVDGMTIQELSKKTGIEWKTINSWRKQQEPADWEVYRIEFMQQRNRMAIQKLTEQFGETLATQLSDSKQLRVLALSAIRSMIQEIQNAQKENRPPDITQQHILCLREFRMCLESVQKQQLTVFGMPDRTEVPFVPMQGIEQGDIIEMREAVRDPILRDALLHLAESLSPDTLDVPTDV